MADEVTNIESERIQDRTIPPQSSSRCGFRSSQHIEIFHKSWGKYYSQRIPQTADLEASILLVVIVIVAHLSLQGLERSNPSTAAVVGLQQKTGWISAVYLSHLLRGVLIHYHLPSWCWIGDDVLDGGWHLKRTGIEIIESFSVKALLFLLPRFAIKLTRSFITRQFLPPAVFKPLLRCAAWSSGELN